MAAAMPDPLGTRWRWFMSHDMQRIGDRFCFVLADLSSRLKRHFLVSRDFALNIVELAEIIDRFLRNLALLGRVQLEEFALGMRHAAGLLHALGEQRLIAGVIVAHERATPLPQEVAGMLTCSTLGKVIDHRLGRIVRADGVGP